MRSAKGGRAPLASAVVFGHGAAVRYLLSKGAKTNLGDVGFEPRCVSGQCRDRESTAGSWDGSEKQRERDFPGLGGPEPILVFACFSYNADPQIVKMLLDRGADPAAKSQQGRTPLELARERGYEEVARLLVQAIDKQQAAEKGKP